MTYPEDPYDDLGTEACSNPASGAKHTVWCIRGVYPEPAHYLAAKSLVELDEGPSAGAIAPRLAEPPHESVRPQRERVVSAHGAASLAQGAAAVAEGLHRGAETDLSQAGAPSRLGVRTAAFDVDCRGG
jgi:hypothetical protein